MKYKLTATPTDNPKARKVTIISNNNYELNCLIEYYTKLLCIVDVERIK